MFKEFCASRVLYLRVDNDYTMLLCEQHVKKAVWGLVDFAITLINSILNLLNEQVKFLGNSTYIRTVHVINAHQHIFQASLHNYSASTCKLQFA